MIKTLFKLILLMSTSLLLAGCPMPYTNTLGINSPNASPLPNPIRKQQALVYITQTTTAMDYFLVGGTASEGWKYHGTDILINSNLNPNQLWLGSSLFPGLPLCFYADPGNYTITFDSKGINPEYINQSIHLQAGKAYFYALDYKNLTGFSNGSIQFQTLTENQGKNLLDKSQNSFGISRECSEFKNLPNINAPRLYYEILLINESRTHYQLSGPNIGSVDITGFYTKLSMKLAPKLMLSPNEQLKTRYVFTNSNTQEQTAILTNMSSAKGLKITNLTELSPIYADPHHNYLLNEGCQQSTTGHVTHFECSIKIISGKKFPIKESSIPVH